MEDGLPPVLNNCRSALDLSGIVENRLTQSTLLTGVRYLAKKDKHLAGIADMYGPPPLWERDPGFHTLIRIILEQQVSLKSAKAAYEKLELAIHLPTPDRFLKLSDTKLKKVGFSRQKSAYARQLAKAITEGRLDLSRLNRLADDEARKELMKMRGIGPWTADIYLLRALGRPDIWPRGDLALAIAMQRLRGWRKRPAAEKLVTISKNWQPWRAVAARMLWHFYLSDNKVKMT